MKGIFPIVFLILAGCASNQGSSQSGIESIKFGSGGGFTNVKTSYQLGSDGQLSKITDGLIGSPIKKVDRKTLQTILDQAKSLKILKYNEPENVYSFIIIKSNGVANEIVWGLGSQKVNSSVSTFYGQLIALTK